MRTQFFDRTRKVPKKKLVIPKTRHNLLGKQLCFSLFSQLNQVTLRIWLGDLAMAKQLLEEYSPVVGDARLTF